MRWIKLEPIIQSEVIQKEKHQYSIRTDQIRSVTQLCPTLCDPMNCSMPGLPVHHQHRMEFIKMVMKTLYVRQQKRHRHIEQSFGLCVRGWGWDDLGEWHWNVYIIICEMNRQSRFDVWDRVLRAGALGWPWEMGWGGRWRGVQDGGHMYTHGWFMWMYGKNHHNIAK